MFWFRKIYSSRKTQIFLGVLLVASLFLLPKTVYAGLNDVLVSIVGWFFFKIIIPILGAILTFAISALIEIAKFSNFVDSELVSIGWVVVRDIANLFVVIVLMVIAFSTVTGKKDFEYQSTLPKLILAAILINFSKGIIGFLVDISQVVMLTFVHAFEDVTAANLVYGLGVDKMLKMREMSGGAISGNLILMTTLINVALLAIGAYAIFKLFVVLLQRWVTILLLLIASPLIFVIDLIPSKDISSYKGKYWSHLSKALMDGPFFAFLFWAVMAFLSAINIRSEFNFLNPGGVGAQTADGSTGWFASQISSTGGLVTYILIIILLLYIVKGMKAAGAAATAAFKAAGGAIKGIKRGYKRGVRRAKRIGQKTLGSDLVKRSAPALWAKNVIQKKAPILSKEKRAVRRDLKRGSREARIAEKYGGKTEEMGAAADNLRKDFAARGMYKNRQTTIKAAQRAIRKGNYAHSLAHLRQLAGDKDLSPELIQSFKTKFKGKRGTQNILRQSDKLWDMQKAAGDDSVDMKRKVAVSADGKYYERNSQQRGEFLDRKFKGRSVNEVVTGSTLDNLLSSDAKDEGIQHFLSQVAATGRVDKLGRLDEGKRDALLELIQRTMAKDHESGGKVFENNQSRADAAMLANILTGMKEKDARGEIANFNGRTGDVRSDLIDEAKKAAGDGSFENVRLIKETSRDSEGKNLYSEKVDKKEQGKFLKGALKRAQMSDVFRNLVDLEDVEVDSEMTKAIQAIDTDVGTKDLVREIQGQVKSKDVLTDVGKYNELKKNISQLNNKLASLSESAKVNFGALGQQINNLDIISPESGKVDALMLETMAQQYGITQKGLDSLMGRFSEPEVMRYQGRSI